MCWVGGKVEGCYDVWAGVLVGCLIDDGEVALCLEVGLWLGGGQMDGWMDGPVGLMAG